MVAALLMVASVILSAPASPKAKAPASKPAESRPAQVDISLLIVGAPAVQRELNCTPKQCEAIDQLMALVHQPIWRWRDYPPEKSRPKVEPLMAQFEAGLEPILKSAQRERLNQLVLQRQGPDALENGDLAEALALTSEQTGKLQSVIGRTRRSLALLQQRPERVPGQRYKAALALRTREQEEILAVLSEPQRKKWAELRGERFNLAAVEEPLVRAPELVPGEWINSPGLTLEGLRGKVVVVHFWTFACGNCIHNYPHYKAWQRDLAPKGVTLIGIHTPETAGERKVDSVRRSATENGLTFPILIDNDRANWDAWGNSIWPSVYLVDKQGRVRTWWYGELNWAGAKGEAAMRAVIDELLVEKPSTRPSR